VAVQSYQFFDGVQLSALNAWTSANQFKMALFNTQPPLNQGSYSSLTGEVANGNGYTTGGLALPATLSNTVYAASVWSGQSGANTLWTSGHTYSINNVVASASVSTALFRCVTAGVAGGGAPSQTTEGALDTNATTAQFVNTGQSIEVWTSGTVTWTASGGSIGPAQWAVIYDNVTSGKPNLMLISFGTSQTATTGNTFGISPDPLYGWWYSIPQ
jgi:hypothetical protein